MRLHVETLFSHDERGDLLRVNEPGGNAAPRFFLGMTSDGPLLRFRHDVNSTTRDALKSIVAAAPVDRQAPPAPVDAHPYETILARSAAVTNVWAGPAFALPDVATNDGCVVRITESNAHCLEPLLHGWMADVRRCQPMLAVIVDHQAVAVCCSVRQTDRAHEAGVETALIARGHGYATAVVGAWAQSVRKDSRISLYSTSWKNAASRSLARKLNLLAFGSDLHIT
jgi:hypothetical protein